ncbi:MAG TPA: hypothetical protein VLC46_27145 [Thermoanaerobaculia bacterium]|jgi:hypothetical protein|nr:hypothetical protein [Thermoanaerobaculia bacterium]
MRRIADALLLAAIVVFGAVLRFGGIAVPSLWLDEILDYDVATKLTHEPLWHWLTGFASEHGPLFFASELAGRFAHSPEFAARFAPGVFGVLAVLIAGVGGRGSGVGEGNAFGGKAPASTPESRAGDGNVPGGNAPNPDSRLPTTESAGGVANVPDGNAPNPDSRLPTTESAGGDGNLPGNKAPTPDPRLTNPESITFALLLAGSPLAIYYSREARPYALLMLLATAMMAALLGAVARSRGFAVSDGSDAAHPRERATTRLLFVFPFLALFTTSGAAPLLVATALTAGIAFLFDRRRLFALYAGASLLAALLVPLLYRRMAGNTAAAGFRPLNARFFQRLLQSFSVGAVDATTIHRAAYIVLTLALVGAVVLVGRDRVRGAIVIGMAVLPILVSLISLWWLRHWYAVRYIATALPAYLLLTAIGITALVRLVLRGRMAIAVPIVALIAAGFIVREGWPTARNEPYRKLNWRVIAATIHEHAHARDAVVTTNDWSYVCLDFYLRRLPPRVRLISAGESSSRAASVVAHNEPVWIVSAGFHRPGDIGDWSCQYPVVLASPLESFRLHYVPGIRNLLLNRLTPADTRASGPLSLARPAHGLRQRFLPGRRLVRPRGNG